MVTSLPYAVEGTPYAMKVARTVWCGGKRSDYIKALPIAIFDTPNDTTIAGRLR